MKVKLSNDTFIRATEQIGYICNQTTKLERMYDDAGIDYLRTLSRESQDVEDIVTFKLLPLYQDVDFNVVFRDYTDFLKELSLNDFVFLGDSIAELNINESSYLERIKKNKSSSEYYQTLNNSVNLATQEAAFDSIRNHPHLMSLQFELTSKCNERCIHCYIPNAKKDNGIDMPFNLFKRVIDEFAEMGGLQVSLSGGEVFMHPDIIPIMSYCREKDMQITILSNLISLTKRHVEAMKSLNIMMVQASLYSMTDSIHDSITKVQGSFRKTKDAIEILVSENIPVIISCPMLKANANCYHEILSYAHSIGIKAQTDFILMAQENLCTDNLANRLSLLETSAVIREILLNAGTDSIDTIHATYQPNRVELKESHPICAAGFTNLCVNANGDVFPCNGWQGFKAGNVYKQSLADMWVNSEALKELRKITRGSFIECRDCDVKEYCAICLARNYNESDGNALQINPHLCEIARLNKQIHEVLSL